MRAIVALCPPHFLLNVTLDSRAPHHGRLRRRPDPGARRGDAAGGAPVRQAPIAHPYDVVVVTNMGYPADTTLYQSVKGMSVAAEGVREGGAILLVAGCEEGIGSDDYDGGPARGAESPEALLQRILHTEQPRARPVADPVPGDGAGQGARARCTRMLTPEQTRAAHVEYPAPTPQRPCESLSRQRRRRAATAPCSCCPTAR